MSGAVFEIPPRPWRLAGTRPEDLIRARLANAHENGAQPLAPLSELERVPCLVLLGAAGMGKTRELAAERRRLAAHAAAVRRIGLASIKSREDLVRPVLRAFSDGLASQAVHLLLDGLDEAPSGPYAAGEALADALSELSDVQRAALRLRVACRTAVWPEFADLWATLQTLWPAPETLQVRHLVPLDDEQILACARSRLGDEGLAAFARKLDAAPKTRVFASNPQRLKMLLSLAADERLPRTERELFDRGCFAMAEPKEPARAISAGERLAVAGRCAAISLLTQGGIQSTDSELVGGREPLWTGEGGYRTEQTIEVGLAAITEARRGTGLFEHRSFEEYLAGRRLAQHPRPLDVLALLRADVQGEVGVIPRLQGVAAWLAAFSPAVRDVLIREEPELLVESDAIAADDGIRARLVAGVIDSVRTGRVRPWELPYRRLDHLAYPELAADLWSVIESHDEPTSTRFAALHVAASMAPPDLARNLAGLALDHGEPLDLRDEAVRALRAVPRHDADDAKRELRPLATRRPPERWNDRALDPEDQLRGGALSALWPELMNDATMLECLEQPRAPHFHGAYAGFISRTLVENVERIELVPALAWLSRHRRWGVSNDYMPWNELANALLSEAWRRVGEAPIRAAFAALLMTALEDDRTLHTEFAGAGWISEESASRRALLTEIVNQAAARGEDTRRLMVALRAWTAEMDLEWLAELASEPRAGQALWRELFEGVAWAAAVPSVLEVCERWPAARDAISWLVGPIAFGSEDEVRMRSGHESYLRFQASESEDAKRRAAEQRRRNASVLDAAREAQRRAPSASWLTLAHSVHYTSSDVTRAPWWVEADSETRAEVCGYAEAYLTEPPSATPWLGTDHVPLSEIAGWLALGLLLNERPDVIADGPADLSRWTGILLTWSGFGAPPFAGHNQILRRAIDTDRSQALDVIEEAVCDQGPDASHYVVFDRLGPLLWPELAAALRRWLGESRLGLDDCARAVSLLLDRDPDASWAFDLLLGGSLEVTLRACVAATLVHHDTGYWSKVWDRVTSDDALGRAFVSRVTRGPREVMNPTLRSRLAPGELAAVFLWLERQRSPRGLLRPRHARDGAHIDWLEEWHGSLLNELRDRGTPEAVEALRGLQDALPELEWLSWAVADARARVRAETWRPLTPLEVQALLDDRWSPWVRDVDDFFERISWAFERYQERLYEQSPDWRHLWRDPGRQPTIENDCTEVVVQRVVDFLNGRVAGFSASLDERFRCSWRRGTGEEPDAVLRATTASGGTVEVVVEAKRDSHDVVDTALDTQLVDRYLDTPKRNYGLFLVYFFGLENAELDELRERFAAQAESASRRVGKRVRAIVLDARGPDARRSASA